MSPRNLHLFLGGHDLEMVTIGELGREVLGHSHVHDAGLAWGAKASAYEAVIARVIEARGKPVLIELEPDLPAHLQQASIIIDHHGDRAGIGKPASLRQVFDLLQLPEARWTRRFALVAANDVGHIRALREAGATAAEIRAIRDQDRAAQGVTPDDEAAARQALAHARWQGRLMVVRLDRERTSPVGDFIEPEYGGTGADNLLVLTPQAAHFFGEGEAIAALRNTPGSWCGGALPERGFWGAPLSPTLDADSVLAVLMRHLR